MRDRRFANGAINFERYEVKFNLDEKGKPLGVFFKESKEANHLIEELMLLANKTVAEVIGKVPKDKKPRHLFTGYMMFLTLRSWICLMLLFYALVIR